MPPLSKVSLFTPGGAAPGVSPGMQAIIQQQQADQSKLLKNVQKLQEENQVENQQAREAGGAGMADVANQITTALDARAKAGDQKRDRVEGLQQQQDFAQFQANLNRDAAVEATRIGTGIQAQREAVANFTESFRDRKATVKNASAAKREQLRKMLDDGLFFRQENGLQRYSDIVSALDDVDAAADDHFSDDNLAEVYEMQNQVVRDIIAGEDTMDLNRLRVNPLLVETPGVLRSNRRKPKLDGQQRFERKLSEGYPLEGTLVNPPQPGEVPPKLMTPEFMLDVLMKDQELTSLVDEKNRRKLVDGWKRKAIKTNRLLMDMKDTYDGMNQQTATMAPQAVSEAIKEFLELEDPNKFSQMPRLITALALKNMFPENGHEMSGRALDIFDGKRELKTTQEAMEGMILESASFAVQKNLLNMMKGPAGSQPVIEQIIQQFKARGDSAGLLRFADFDPSGVSGEDAVNIRAAVMRKLTSVHGFASRMNQGLKHVSSLEGFRQALSKNVREVDLLSTHHLLSQNNDKAIALKMLDSSLDETARGLSLEQVEGALPSAAEENLQQQFNMMDALIIHAQEMGPDTLREVAHAISGGQIDISSPNMKIYENDVKRGESDDTTRFLMEQATRTHKRRKEARQKRFAEGASKEQGDPSKGAFATDQPAGQAFEKGGVIPATTNILSKVIGGIGTNAARGVKRVGEILPKALGGNVLQSAFETSLEEGRKRFRPLRNKE